MSDIAAIVLAAGQSRRMGIPKMTLSWGETTVIGHIVDILREAGISNIIVVTGGTHREVSNTLVSLPVQLVYNERFTNGEMLSSCQTGLVVAAETNADAAMIVLGDQPQIQMEVVCQIIQRWQTAQSILIVPSYQMRRGHPWVVGRNLWPAIHALNPPQTLRSFLSSHQLQIDYLEVDTPSILQDLDTLEDYQAFKPRM
jgi:molybdenum cofactor cytidylyltransferase